MTLRIAANVPPNSPWDFGMQRLAREFDRVSGGRVRLAFPPSARVASEEDDIRQMRLGLDGALISSQGLAALYPDSLALSMPGFIANDEEFDAVLAAVRPLIEAKLSDRYVLLALTKGGWLRYFSRSPIARPSDLAGLRVSIERGDEKLSRLLESVGSRLVPGSIADFILQMNSGSVDAICESPIYIATLWFQLRGKLAYMTSFKVAPFVGAMIVNKSSWEKVPADLRPKPRAPGRKNVPREQPRGAQARGPGHRLARRHQVAAARSRRRHAMDRSRGGSPSRPRRAAVLGRHAERHRRRAFPNPRTPLRLERSVQMRGTRASCTMSMSSVRRYGLRR